MASGSRIDRAIPNIQDYFWVSIRDNAEHAGSTGGGPATCIHMEPCTCTCMCHCICTTCTCGSDLGGATSPYARQRVVVHKVTATVWIFSVQHLIVLWGFEDFPCHIRFGCKKKPCGGECVQCGRRRRTGWRWRPACSPSSPLWSAPPSPSPAASSRPSTGSTPTLST